MKLPIFLATLFTVVSSFGATITITSTLTGTDTANYHYSASTTTHVVLKTGSGTSGALGTVADLGNDKVFRIGFFQNYDAGVGTKLSSSDAKLSDVLSPTSLNKFIPLGDGRTGYGNDTTANFITKQLTSIDGRVFTSILNVNYDAAGAAANSVATGAVARGTKLFLLIMDSTTISNTADSVKWGLFSASNWVIPASGTAGLTVSFKDVDTQGEVIHGFLGSLGALPSVPEPTTMSLAGLAVLGLISKRRRA